MKRYVTEYAKDVKDKLISVCDKELCDELIDRIDSVISVCHQDLITSREAVREIVDIYRSIYE